MDDAPGGMREYTLDEALEVADFLQRNWKLEEAAEAYRRILEVWPDHPDVLLHAGVLAFQASRREEALALIERSLALAPDRAHIHNNRGILLKELGRLDEAAAAYKRATELDPGHANAYSNLGLLLREQGKLADAEEAYRTAIRLDPEHIGAYLNLAALLDGMGRDQESFECLCRVTTLQPRNQVARRMLAMAYCTLGQPAMAAQIYKEWVQDEPDNAIPEHLLAACSGEGVPARASDAFVEKTFDGFATTFDTKLKYLSYQAPSILGAMIADSGRQAFKNLDVLDVGCGTGLCGPHLAPYARRLTGVDLSGGMLEQARKRELYDDLVKAELTAYLRNHESSFDVIVSADTLCYFGALEEAIGAAAAALRPGGLFVFTVEEAPDTGTASDYQLQTHGRYCHAQAYVERLLAGAGLSFDLVHAELRMESRVPVKGLAVRATKPAAGQVTASPAPSVAQGEAGPIPVLGAAPARVQPSGGAHA